jgi:F-type H+-transporting ATPase subunit b
VLLASSNFGLSYILEVVSVLIVIGAFYWKAWPPLRARMLQRQQTIGSQLSAGDEARAQAAALVAQRRAELERAETEAAAIISQARESAAALEVDGQRRANEDYERIVARAEVEAIAARARVESEIMAELADVIINASRDVVIAELDTSVQHRLIGEVIVAAESEA